MWKRKLLKDRAIYNMHRNYWQMLGIILILSFLVGGFRQIHIGNNTVEIKNSIVKTKEAIEETLGSRIETTTVEEIVDTIIIKNNKERVYDVLQKHYKPTEGVLADLYNKVATSKSFTLGMLNTLNQTFFKGRIDKGIIIFLGSLGLFFVYFLIYLPLYVGKCRFVLESSRYDNITIGRLRFPWVVKSSWNISKAMILKQIYLFLWSLTGIGWFIKSISYMMVPYILAENPKMKGKDAITLSRKMVFGHKWNIFKLELSFIGWEILGVLTFGILNFTFTNIYKDYVYGELYNTLKDNLKLGESFEYDVELKEDNFVEESKKNKFWSKLDYKKSYTLDSLVLIFFTFAMIGWLWEAFIYIYEQGIFVNRGTLHGPWLPIYGSGGLLVVVLLKKINDRPGLTFCISIILCGILEYVTATFLWYKYNAIWWDYSGYFLNLDGRICAEGLLIFGVGAMAFIYILAPFFDKVFMKIPKGIRIGLVAVLLSLFIVDLVYSYNNPNKGVGITEYKTIKERQDMRMKEAK